eukprot:CAMPEP_0201703366 /NCGR_PEP_ID=MMETSP0578-20130828/39503_1 /ASSEMBLY_ACC=CAM_ASM_000663 /TAXON_ID=267565 /ORGANISM="Skeletonema grethea, Strain CCMP 1804" /LENGTH=361 /DNA_ID=CAMNT_0048191123 /DNA_START=39 /DNA_END=1121 /DNA_ORIENTATION=-
MTAHLPITSAAQYSDFTSHAWNDIERRSAAPTRRITSAFQYVGSSSLNRQRSSLSDLQRRRHWVGLKNSGSNNDVDSKSSFLSTKKASVSFNRNNNSNSGPANLSAIDSLLFNLTSDRTSLLLGSVGIVIVLLNRIISFPEDAAYEASRSRIDLLAVFAAGSVLLNGISKLDVESVTAEQVALEGINEASSVVWNDDNDFSYEGNTDVVEWGLFSFLKCSPARTAVFLGKEEGKSWIILAMTGILPLDSSLRKSLRSNSTPILDRMLRDDGNIKGGTVGGAEVIGSQNRKGPKESYLPTLQALPGKVEFSYLPSNAQEALLLPVLSKEGDTRRYAVVLGGDRAKSFAPRDISWCREIASWL